MTDADTSEATRAEVHALLTQMLKVSDPVQGIYRKHYRHVGHIAHGWMRRVVRTVEAILVLQQAGFAGEVQPLMRSVVEHSVALRWLSVDGDAVEAPLKTNHRAQVDRFFTSVKEVSGEFDEEVVAATLASFEHDDHGRDFLQQFAHRVSKFGTAFDLASYHAEMMSSHATYASAADYLGDDVSFQMTHIAETDYRLIAAIYLCISMEAYSTLFVAKPWTQVLPRVRADLERIEPMAKGTV